MRVWRVLVPSRRWCSYDASKTHFGYETVSKSEKGEKVYEVFRNVATKYDTMNDAMSLGVHRWWKDMFVRRIQFAPDMKLIDVAGGTGDIAFRVVSAQKTRRWMDGSIVTVCDINRSMLEVGKKRAEESKIVKGLEWVEANAERLPFEDASFDAYTIAFGIRNCTNVDQVLREAYRVLKPGGQFLCLEFSKVQNGILSRLYDLYSFEVIPVLGQLIANDWRSYKYLVESIRKFPPQQDFAQMIEQARFESVTFENLTMGIVAIHEGMKS